MTLILKLVFFGITMELTLVFVYYLVNISFCKGFKISTKFNFDDEAVAVSDLLNVKFNDTKNELSRPVGARSFEAKMPVTINEKNDGYEIKIPLTVENNKTEVENEGILFTGSLFPERRSDSEGKKSDLNPLFVKGSLDYLKPDFLIPLPHERTTIKSDQKTTNNYNFLNYWSDRTPYEHKTEIEGLKPPDPDNYNGKWILNTIPLIQIEKITSLPPRNNEVVPSAWQIIESGVWNSHDPMPWNKERKNGWALKKEGWSNSKSKYHSRNVIYPIGHQGWNNFYGEPLNTPSPKDVWISCPPFEVGGVSRRQSFPGCPQSLKWKPETVSVTPAYIIDDKTLFKELEQTKPEEPKN